MQSQIISIKVYNNVPVIDHKEIQINKLSGK